MKTGLTSTMQIFHGYLEAKKKLNHPVVTIGNFDGLHLGHQELIKRAIMSARRRNVQALAYTFTPHPSKVLPGKNKPELMMTDEQKEKGFAKLGLDAAVFESFTSEFSKIPAEEFMERVLVNGLFVSEVIVGENFSFGYRGQGSSSSLKSQLAKYGIDVQIVPPVIVEGGVCSSSRIRDLIRQGDVAQAARLLGRHYSLDGPIVHGAGRGQKIGVPSANLEPKQELLPGVGVYATLSKLPGVAKLHLGATNVGRRPTFGEGDRVHIETHILDFSGTLYEQEVELFFVEKIRDEKRFDSVDELKVQIQKDLESAQSIRR